MFQFIESIRIENGEVYRVDLHQERIDRTYNHFFQRDGFKLESILQQIQLNEIKRRTKLRIVYGLQNQTFELKPYEVPCFEELLIKEDPNLAYPFKFLDRKSIEQLGNTLNTKQGLLISKNQLITDGSFYNVAFYHKEKKWVTPSTPLLNGTHRKDLLLRNKIKQEKIHINTLHTFEKVMLFNSMLDWEEIVLPIKGVTIPGQAPEPPISI